MSKMISRYNYKMIIIITEPINHKKGNTVLIQLIEYNITQENNNIKNVKR